MKRTLLRLGSWALLGALIPTVAIAGGDEVIVIYNSRVPESKRIAEHYAERRHVPKSQVLGLEMSSGNDMSRTEFRDALQKPLLKKLVSDGLWRLGRADVPGTNGKPVRVEGKVLEAKVRYAVLCQGVPVKITRDPNLKESAEETLRPEFRRNEACVDSELACLPLNNLNPTLAGPLRNPLYSVTNAAWFHPTNGVFLVARLDGPGVDVANALVDKAIQAETDGLWGRAYFDVRGITEPGMKQGDDWIRGAAEIAQRLGFETVLDTNGSTFPASFPMSQIAFYEGWYTESVSGALALPKVEFMPGAFAYHLHSFSAAALRSTNQNWTGPLLARGATISMGCVDEPYLGGTPDMAVFTARLIYQGFTFGEAAYSAQNVLSWQTTVVGDPLYRPFGREPQELHDELERRHSKLIEWSHLRWANLNLVRGAAASEVAAYLEGLTVTKESAVLNEKLGDLYAAQGKPSSTIHAYEQALKLDPSPQQRIRLRLTLGEKLVAQNRDEEAYANYRKFLEESPEYPDKQSILQKLLSLAQKLGKQEDTAKFAEQSKLLTTPAPAKQ